MSGEAVQAVAAVDFGHRDDRRRKTREGARVGARLEEPQQGKTVWQGRVGEASLRVDMLPSGRIAATWATKGNERRAVVDTIQQLEQRVLFQLMLGAGPDSDVIAQQILAAVIDGQQGLPDPTQASPGGRPRKRGGPRRGGRPRYRRR